MTIIHTDAGYYTPVTPPGGAGGPSYMHVWYLKDHLGNNRVLADGGGKEWGVPTSTYDFEARQFSPYFHRFTSMDPLAEKYYSISPYAYCADDPVNVIDKNGDFPLATNLLGAAAAAGTEYVSQVVSNVIVNGFSKEAFTNVDFADIGVAAVEGFVTSGASIVKSQATKALVRVASSTAKNIVDFTTNSGSESGGVTFNDMETVLTASMIDYATLPFAMMGKGKVNVAKTTTKSQAVRRAHAHAHEIGGTFGKSEAKKVAKQTVKRNKVAKEINQIATEEVNDFWINTSDATVKKWIFDEE